MNSITHLDNTAAMANLVRRLPDRMVTLLYLIGYLREKPTLMLDRNGRGGLYYILKCAGFPGQDRGPRRKNLYIGRLNAEEAALMKSILHWWPLATGTGHRRLIEMEPYLKELRRVQPRIMAHIRHYAAVTGFRFVGYSICRRSSGPATPSIPADQALGEGCSPSPDQHDSASSGDSEICVQEETERLLREVRTIGRTDPLHALERAVTALELIQDMMSELIVYSLRASAIERLDAMIGFREMRPWTEKEKRGAATQQSLDKSLVKIGCSLEIVSRERAQHVGGEQ